MVVLVRVNAYMSVCDEGRSRWTVPAPDMRRPTVDNIVILMGNGVESEKTDGLNFGSFAPFRGNLEVRD